MQISKERLLLIPENMEQPDIEEMDTIDEQEEQDEFMPQKSQQPQQQVKDFDFGDDFW